MTCNSRDAQMRELRILGSDVACIDLCPPIQACVIDKSILNEDFKVIYPENYCSGYFGLKKPSFFEMV